VFKDKGHPENSEAAKEHEADHVEKMKGRHGFSLRYPPRTQVENTIFIGLFFLRLINF
jgi:hypothetical protein